jgi:hypothetical protein
MTVTIELPELVGARIQNDPQGMERAKALLAHEFAGIDLDAVAAIRETFEEGHKDYPLEEAFAMIDKGVAKLKEEKAKEKAA